MSGVKLTLGRRVNGIRKFDGKGTGHRSVGILPIPGKKTFEFEPLFSPKQTLKSFLPVAIFGQKRTPVFSNPFSEINKN